MTLPISQVSAPATHGVRDANFDVTFETHCVSEAIREKLRAVNEPPDGPFPGPRRRARWPWLLAVLAALGGAAGGVYAWVHAGPADTPLRHLEFQPAERGKLVLSIVERGELEAAKNVEVICKVRSSGRGNSVASSIKWVIDDGTMVKKGDVICRLDDAGLQEQLQNELINVAEKRELLVRAERDEEIIESQNRIDLQTAANAVRLAEIALEKYTQGDLEQKRRDVAGRLTLAESDLIQWKERVAWSSRMVKKGYITASQLQSDETKLKGAEIALKRIEEEQRVLNAYESQMQRLDLENRLAQARENYNVVQIQAKSKKSQANARYQAALSVFNQEEAKLEDLHEDIANCTILAPSEGMVLYNIPEQARSLAGSQQSIIAVGEPVREGQRLFRIPDLRHMQVRIKVHESLVPRLRGDRVHKTGFGDALTAGLLCGPCPSVRLTAALTLPDVLDDFEDLETEIVEPGMPAKIKVAALERPVAGHVKWISPVNSSTDFMSSDVKVYPTINVIDEPVEGLKPGMTAEVTILVDELDDVLRIPVNAVLEAGGKKFCYVRMPTGVEKRRLITGLNNSRFIEIKEGSDLREGEEVVQNPRQLAERLGDLHADYKDPAEGMKQSGKGKPIPGRGKGVVTKQLKPEAAARPK
jgi:HlyD family secretion protein